MCCVCQFVAVRVRRVKKDYRKLCLCRCRNTWIVCGVNSGWEQLLKRGVEVSATERTQQVRMCGIITAKIRFSIEFCIDPSFVMPMSISLTPNSISLWRNVYDGASRYIGRPTIALRGCTTSVRYIDAFNIDNRVLYLLWEAREWFLSSRKEWLPVHVAHDFRREML